MKSNELIINKKVILSVVLPVILIASLVAILEKLDQRRAFARFLQIKSQLVNSGQIDGLSKLVNQLTPTEEKLVRPDVPEDNALVFEIVKFLKQIDSTERLLKRSRSQLIVSYEKQFYILNDRYCPESRKIFDCYVTITEYLGSPLNDLIKRILSGEEVSDRSMFMTLRENNRKGIGMLIRLDNVDYPGFFT